MPIVRVCVCGETAVYFLFVTKRPFDDDASFENESGRLFVFLQLKFLVLSANIASVCPFRVNKMVALDGRLTSDGAESVL